MMLDQAKLEEASKKSKTDFDKVILYPYAKFPAEIIADKLYLVKQQ